jgi:ATP-dependent RNA helicase DDX31/DBP7
MADDGLLLNFEVPHGALLQKTVFRGGPWRERRRFGLRERRRAGEPPSAKDRTLIQTKDASDGKPSTERLPNKRQKVDSQRAPGPRGFGASNNTSLPRKHVISSLFSSNPASQSLPAAGTGVVGKDSEKNEPSNGPLTSDTMHLTSIGLNQTIASHLGANLLITKPTAIQKSAIPVLLGGDSDAFIQAETGSGKTLAYLLPIIQRIMNQASAKDKSFQRKSGLFAIVLAPTRELCKQISTVLESVLRCAHCIVSGSVLGGEKKKSEKARLRKGLNILVATPGRLADHIQHTEALDVSMVRWLVLDEGDRLMELGFEEDIRKIISALDFRVSDIDTETEVLPQRRVTILCSATMRGDVQRLGDISLNNAQHISAGSAPDAQGDTISKFSVPAQLKQTYIVVPAKLRLVTAIALLKKAFRRCPPTLKVIVFLSCADSVDFHFKVLSLADDGLDSSAKELDSEVLAENSRPVSRKRTGGPGARQDKAKESDAATSAQAHILSDSGATVMAFRLHGSLAQAVRTSTLKAFTKSEHPSLLICTDIASRGLDLPDVDRVIELDPAFSREEHLHRVGRTARAGHDGSADIILMPGCEEGYLAVLKEERCNIGTSAIRGLSAEQIMKSGFPGRSQDQIPSSQAASGDLKPWEQVATDLQLRIERWVLQDPSVLEGARRAFQSHVRAYATHVKEEREWFDIKQLHLGHLAKAFGLRDRPGTVNVPGMRTSAAQVKEGRKKAGAGNAGKSGDDMAESRKKMRKMGLKLRDANEFNLA